ncbi:protein TOPAZ1 isoform X2 [Micropterus salmoides]|uniref:protein TOPAZ1 isoform X2 n=1 Tax=Micropterus salmoides TaxID=27706 RepID=UPI0018EA6CA6|nr:protein TOPAZ1 isoform X2 [Micropterus salmoides]
MFPSSSRVKLNRVALKDVIGLKLVPRRRRVPKSQNNVNVTADSEENQEENQLQSMKDTNVTPLPCCSEHVQTPLTDQIWPENVTDTTGAIPEGEPEENRVDFDRNTHPSPTGLADSERSSRRAVRTSHCGLCGDCKYISPQRKTLGKQGQESSCPGPERPTIEVNIKNENTVTETSKNIVIWIDQYPKVPLCDIAQKCDLSHNCGYVLPDVLKTKVVHCFKQDMRAGFQFVPGCLGHNKHQSDEGALAKEFCPRAQSEKSVCQSQSLTKHLNELAGAKALSSHPSCRFLNSWTSDDSATCSASFLLGKRTKKGECRTGMWDSDVEEDPGPGSHLIGAEIRRDKRIKRRDSVNDGILPSTSDLESKSCKNPAKTDTRDKEKTCLGNAVGDSSKFGSAVKENCKNPCGERDNPTKSDAAQLSSERFCQRNEVDTDDLESFTCQRARVYFRKNISSCARTYMSWPFSNSVRTLTAHAPASGRAHQFSNQNKEKQQEDSESILVDRNGKRHNMSSNSSDSAKCATHLMEAEESLASLPSDTATLSNPRQHGREPGTDTASASPLPGPKTDSSLSTPSPSALGLSDWETATTLSSMSSPFTHGGLSSLSATPSSLPPPSFLLQKVKRVELAEASPTKCMVRAVGKTLFCCEETRTSPPYDSDSFHSCESSLLLPQDEQESDEDLLAGRSKGRSTHNILTDKCADIDLNELMLPPALSPVNTPQGPSQTSFQHPGCSSSEEEEAEEINKDSSKHEMLPECHKAQIVNGNNDNSRDYIEHGVEEFQGASTNLPTTQTSTSNDEDDVDDGNEEEDQDDRDYEDDVEQVNKQSEQVPSDPKIKATLTSSDLTEPCSSPSSDEDDGGAFREEGQPRSARDVESSPSEISDSERDETKVESADNTEQGILDEVTAYEQDILLVDVVQFDPELFENLPQESSLKLGPSRVTETPNIRPIGGVKTQSSGTDAASPRFEQRSFPVHTDFHCDSPITEESSKRPWRPQCGSSPFKRQSSASPAAEKQTKYMGLPDANNNHVNKFLERSQPVQTVTSLHYHIPPLMTQKIGPRITNPANLAEFRRQKSNAYCRQYFSESLSCGFKMCRFQHVPVEGDEKFCIDTVTRFTKNPACLQKARAVFTGYYQNNPPGVYFSMPVLLSLLWSLLQAGMVSDVFSVLSISVAHKIVPGHEFLLALFNLVREKGLVSFVPELMQLTFKMASTGLELSLDCLDCVKNTPEFQQTVYPNSLVSVLGNHKLSSSAPFPEYLNLAHAIVEVELCTKQEDWRRMGEVFRSICQSSQHPNQVERISGRIAIALLSESKDKLSLPFAAFADTMCQAENEDSLIRSFLGRIGVSLMLRYHKTHQWAKGRRVVEVLSIAKIEYSTLKGLFGNEDGASRCYLVTVATELFLLSGSVEGALNTLRENKWFLSSRSWPCEPADLESRTRVLIRLAEKTSHRDTLDVLRNLPGLKEPNDTYTQTRQAEPLAPGTGSLQTLCKCGVLPGGVGSPWFHVTDRPLSSWGGGAGSHL